MCLSVRTLPSGALCSVPLVGGGVEDELIESVPSSVDKDVVNLGSRCKPQSVQRTQLLLVYARGEVEALIVVVVEGQYENRDRKGVELITQGADKVGAQQTGEIGEDHNVVEDYRGSTDDDRRDVTGRETLSGQ